MMIPCPPSMYFLETNPVNNNAVANMKRAIELFWHFRSVLPVNFFLGWGRLTVVLELSSAAGIERKSGLERDAFPMVILSDELDHRCLLPLFLRR